MTGGTGRALLTRAEELADTAAGLAAQITEIIGRARAARVDQDALAGLVTAVRILGGDVTALFRAARGRHHGGPYQHDTALLDAVEEISGDLAAAAAAAGRLHALAGQALHQAREDQDAAGRALAAAREMPAAEPCQGCHQARASAIAAAQHDLGDARERASQASAALDVLAALKLRQALRAVRRVPEDLNEVYTAAYDLVTRDPRAMPADGDFITGHKTPAAMAAAMLTARARSPRPGEHAYTPPVPDSPRPVTLLLACRHVKKVISDASTGELLADDAECPQCGTAQWVTGTRE
jgi:hypothetical protein